MHWLTEYIRNEMMTSSLTELHILNIDNLDVSLLWE